MMKITPTRYWIETEVSEEKKCGFPYEIINQYYPDDAMLEFSRNTTLYEISICILECFKSEELPATCITFSFNENKVVLYKSNLKELSAIVILEAIASQIK